jgi:hypothetical protein
MTADLPVRLRLRRAGEPRTRFIVTASVLRLATNAAKRDAAGMIGWHAATLANVYGHHTLEAPAKLIAENIRCVAYGETPLNLVTE